MQLRNHFLVPSLVIAAASFCHAKDYYLTIGGGYSPAGNQASLEKNVLFFQRLLRQQSLDSFAHDIFFSDGTEGGLDLQVIDRDSVPEANRLMAEFFGSSQNLGLTYRNHRVPDVRGNTKPENIRKWFGEVGSTLQPGDRLCLYVTAHGNRSGDRQNPYDTTIATWNGTSIKMSELVGMLDRLNAGVEVVAIMVQCHAGGFARFIFNDGDPEKGLSPQRRSGFFATVHDRAAAGCTPDVDEASYVEYSTYFWAALGGRDRGGQPIQTPDYNHDGAVSFDEAHAYTILSADTIDLPVKTSGEYLTFYSKFGDADSQLLGNDESYELILSLATPAQMAILEGLSEQLQLSGDDRIVDAWRKTQPRRDEGRSGGRGRTRGRRPESPASQLRRRIAADLKKRWPQLANVLNPVSIELVTMRADEFIEAIERHPEYDRYRELADQPAADDQKQIVKYERFLRAADNVALAENLRRMNDPEKLEEYRSIASAEAGTLGE